MKDNWRHPKAFPNGFPAIFHSFALDAYPRPSLSAHFSRRLQDDAGSANLVHWNRVMRSKISQTMQNPNFSKSFPTPISQNIWGDIWQYAYLRSEAHNARQRKGLWNEGQRLKWLDSWLPPSLAQLFRHPKSLQFSRIGLRMRCLLASPFTPFQSFQRQDKRQEYDTYL